MNKRKKIYISVPISGLPLAEARHRADLAKARLSREGFAPVSPFDIYAGKDPQWEDHMSADIRALLDCDGIYMCAGWKLSCGCTIEYETARALMRFRRKHFRIIYETI